jgi:hypothetical protein
MRCDPKNLILNKKARDKYNDYRVHYRKNNSDKWLTYPCVAPFSRTNAGHVYVALNNVGFEVDMKYVPELERIEREAKSHEQRQQTTTH